MITLPSSLYDYNTAKKDTKKDVKLHVIQLSLINCVTIDPRTDREWTQVKRPTTTKVL